MVESTNNKFSSELSQNTKKDEKKTKEIIDTYELEDFPVYNVVIEKTEDEIEYEYTIFEKIGKRSSDVYEKIISFI
ncbi:MAG: hypothetical protein GF364_15160, partial [Candidatus Lokiarchaeota archaeon]|nr:hypothetical protein [Candidatus Lokiarchaeota archaeon]